MLPPDGLNDQSTGFFGVLAGFMGRLDRPNRPFPTARAFGKSNRSTRPSQVAQTVLWHPAFRGGAGDLRWKTLTRLPTPVLPCCFLPDLTRVKFGSTCPPLGRCYRAHQPGQALPNFQAIGLPQPPLPFACALRQSDRSTCHWQVAQTVLWYPVFACGLTQPRVNGFNLLNGGDAMQKWTGPPVVRVR